MQAYAVKPRLLTVAQAAVYIGRTEKSVYMLQANGAFPSVRADSRVMFDLHDLDKWIELNKVRKAA
jgi:excisionase family DNA binding protein